MIYGADLPDDFSLFDLPSDFFRHEYALTPGQAGQLQDLLTHRRFQVKLVDGDPKIATQRYRIERTDAVQK
jgi:hypothetical protein